VIGEGRTMRRDQYTGHQRDKALSLTEFNDLAEKKDTGPEFNYGIIDIGGEAHSWLQAPP
jgi:hypothetical protein